MKRANIIRASQILLLISIFVILYTESGYASIGEEEDVIPCFLSDFSTIAIKEKNSQQKDVTVLEDGTQIVQYYNWDNTYIYFGNYEQDDNPQTKKEPILWRVIMKTDDRLMLVSDKALDMKPFHNNTNTVSWEKSALRAWLNGYDNNPWKSSFLKQAFQEKERDLLQTDALGDCVSILSVAEIKEYLEGAKRVAINTDYVRNKGAIDYNGYSMWWTKSILDNANETLLCGGEVDYVGRNATDKRYAVRPVIWLHFDDISFVSAVEDGKALYDLGKELTSVDRSTDQIYKFTLFDEEQTMDIDIEEVIEAEPGQVFHFPYSNISTGLHNYISAVITYDNPKDASGESIVYYGKLQQARSETGTVTIRIPDDINAGDYKMSLFNETCLTYDKPDYASDFHTFTLKIPMKTEGFYIKEIEDQHYTGQEIRPTVVVTDAAGNPISPLEYRVVYENNTEAGTAIVRVLSKRRNYVYSCIAEKEFRIIGREVPLILTCNSEYGDKVYPNKSFHLIARMEPQEDKEAASGGLMEFYMNDQLLNPGGTPVDYGYAMMEITNEKMGEYGGKTFYAKYIPKEIDIYGANKSNEITVLYKTSDKEERLMNYVLLAIFGIALIFMIICTIYIITYKRKTR